jgi:hypothetical protein
MNQNKLKKIFDRSIKNKGYEGFDFFFYKEDNQWKGQNMETVPEDKVIVVIKSFDWEEYINALFEFNNKLSKQQKENWFKTFTRTIYLFGNPAKLDNYESLFAYRSENLAITFPGKTSEYRGLQLLLRLVNTNKEYMLNDQTICIAANQSKKNNQIAKLEVNLSELKFERVLTHISHIINESLILNRINDIDSINISSVEEINIPPDYTNIRIDIDETNYEKLRTYCLLNLN